MNDSQTLELQLKATGEETLQILKKIAPTIDNIYDATNKATTGVTKLSSAFSKLFTIGGFKKLGKEVLSFLGNASDRAEELNLFNVIFKNVEKNGQKTFSTLGREAMKFQYKLNEAFGTNMTETLRYQGLFQAMATNQGIADKYASIMSENMVKLTYDLASLYNKSEKTTAEALRAGVFAGMTKPLVI